MSIAQYIDHTNLKPTATDVDIIKLCDEAQTFNFRGVCINPCWINLVRKQLKDSDIKIATVVGFPLGANHNGTKVFETTGAINEGVNEIDMVWNLGIFKSRKYLKVVEEIGKIVCISNLSDVKVKVIVETCYLDEGERIKAHQIVKDSGADCIKTSTGSAPRGATLLDVIIWKKLGDLKIKAAGGIRMYSSAKAFIEAGADYLGTSHGVQIIQGESNQDNLLEKFCHFPNPCQTDDPPKEQ